MQRKRKRAADAMDEPTRVAKPAARAAYETKRRANEEETKRQERLKKQREATVERRARENPVERQARLEKQKPLSAERKGNTAERKQADTELMDDDAFRAYTRLDALKSTPEFWHSYKTDARKNLLLYLWNSGHAYLPNYTRIEHGDPRTLEHSWDNATMADGLLTGKDLRVALRAEVVTPQRKMQWLEAYNQRLSLEAELSSCSCCSIRS